MFAKNKLLTKELWKKTSCWNCGETKNLISKTGREALKAFQTIQLNQALPLLLSKQISHSLQSNKLWLKNISNKTIALESSKLNLRNWGTSYLTRSTLFHPLESLFSNTSSLNGTQKTLFSTLPLGVQDPKGVVDVALNNLRDNPGAKKKKRRVGRGPGSTKGKTAGRGMGGQNKRSGGGVRVGFEGGAYPLYKRVRKHGFTNARFKVVYEKINLDRLIQFIIRGRIDPTKPITIKTMYDAGIFRKIKHGVKILGGGASSLKIPLHIEATAVSESAKKAILDAGGTIKRIYFNKVYLRYYLQPEKYLLPIRRAIAHPSIRDRFDDWGQEMEEERKKKLAEKKQSEIQGQI